MTEPKTLMDQWQENTARETARRKAQPHYVYFMECCAPEPQHEYGPIKVGLAVDPSQRLKSMAGHNPFPLRVLRVIKCEDFAAAAAQEKELHQKWEHLRLAGEWFVSHPELVFWMRNHASEWIEVDPESFAIPRTKEEIREFFGLGEDD